jgi:hypothetical protein
MIEPYDIVIHGVVTSERPVLVHLGREGIWGYKGIEIATYVQKEASSVTKYGREEDSKHDVEKIFSFLEKK